MKKTFVEKFNRACDSFARAQICVLHWRHFSAYNVWFFSAFAVATASTLMMVSVLGLSLLTMSAIILAVPLTMILLAMAIKIITGEERHVQYHHTLAIVVVTTTILWLANQPILPYLDLTVFGIGIFVIAGRVGCFKVGCCHGRPSSWGVSYRQEHADDGFVPYYVGVRLLPVQLIESLAVLLIVAVGVLVFFSNYTPGKFLTWYVVAYGFERFWIEFLRGDPARPFVLGYSEPQWTSLVVMCVIVGAEYAGVLPRSAGHLVVTASVVSAMILIAWKRSFQSVISRRLFYPVHIQELAEAIEVATGRATEFAEVTQWTIYPRRSDEKLISIASTSLGIQLSASRIKNKTDEILHYAFSHRDGGMTGETARLLAQLILTLSRVKGAPEIRSGRQGVFHLFVPSQRESGLRHS